MFEKLKTAFSSVTKAATERTLSDKEISSILSKLEMDLVESDVAFDVVQNISNGLRMDLLNEKVKRGSDGSDLIGDKFRASIVEIFSRVSTFDIFERINLKKNSEAKPFIILFLGVNGCGKTTTIAKFAHLLRNRGLSVALAAGDTHRAGAIEQLSEHAERIGIKVVAQRYGADPAAVARDGVKYAESHMVDVVIVDTAGRMQTSKNLMYEMSKIIRVVRPDLKIFVGDALTGNDAVSQAREFLNFTDFDGVILTKIDADAKGGAALSITSETGKPIIYMGVGQDYSDLIPFKPNSFIDQLFDNRIA